MTMSGKSSLPGMAALMIGHCAGMIDLVALPVWVGTLVSKYGFDSQQAGGLATLFLISGVVSSLVLAPRFNRLPVRAVAVAGFALAALAFFGVSLLTAYLPIAVLHVVAGLSVGAALSATHGNIGRSTNPHRLFAIAGLCLGVFGIVILGATPPVVGQFGGAVLFRIFAGTMVVAALAAVIAFPDYRVAPASTSRPLGPMPRSVWFGIAGISAMALVQSMVFSFVERIGMDRGFGLAAVTGVLIATGFIALIPAPAAALLEKRIPATSVILAGPVVQVLVALAITMTTGFAPYAAASAVFVSIMIFTHTFAFGLLSRLDPTGRSVAATPAMLMTGAALGPILGGTLIVTSGYPMLGVAAVVVDLLALLAFSRVRSGQTQPAAT
jgi:predicted MFS family arabinose efflux permease